MDRNRTEPISITGTVVEILEVASKENTMRQQILVCAQNGKHDFKIALMIWNRHVGTLKIGSTYSFYIGSEPWISSNGNYINNLNAYSIKKIN